MYYTIGKGWHLQWRKGDAELFAFISKPRPQEGYIDWAYFGPTVAGNHDSYDACACVIERAAEDEEELIKAKQTTGQTTERKAR